jgi:hypothetical protein
MLTLLVVDYDQKKNPQFFVLRVLFSSSAALGDNLINYYVDRLKS